jgi:hypothetical protein
MDKSAKDVDVTVDAIPSKSHDDVLVNARYMGAVNKKLQNDKKRPLAVYKWPSSSAAHGLHLLHLPLRVAVLFGREWLFIFLCCGLMAWLKTTLTAGSASVAPSLSTAGAGGWYLAVYKWPSSSAAHGLHLPV